jgi:hypothetical protein
MAALVAEPPPRASETPRPPRPPHRRRRRKTLGERLVGLSIVVAALAVAALAVSAAVDSLNPFGSETHDRSQPVLVKSLQDLSDYHAASANMQVVVDVEEDAKLLPSFIKGERVLFLAAGSVDAIVDFRGFKSGRNLRVDGDTITVVLPRAKLGEARLDPARTRVYDRNRGLIDRVEGVFADNPVDEQELHKLAEAKLLAAARADKELMATAERNTRDMLVGMLRGAGFERVIVRFQAAV